VAVVKNITPDVLSLFRADAPPIQPGDKVTVKDANFVGRAWPKSSWELVTPPEGDYIDDDTEDAYCFSLPAQEDEPGESSPEPTTSSRTRAKKES